MPTYYSKKHFCVRAARLHLGKGQPVFLDSLPIVLGPQRRGSPQQPFSHVHYRGADELVSDEMALLGATKSRNKDLKQFEIVRIRFRGNRPTDDSSEIEK
jgi:hypothetical protein